MLSMGHVLILQSDLRWSKQTDVGSTNLMFLMVVIQAHLSISHTFPSWDDSRRRSADSQPLPLSPALGGRVFGLGSCLVRVFNEEERGQCPKSPFDIGRSRRQLGSRHSPNQHIVPERPPYVGFWPFVTSRHLNTLSI